MGVSCSHSNFVIVEKTKPFIKDIFYKTQTITKQCVDCKKLWKEEQIIERITNYHFDLTKKCKHNNFYVKQNTIKKSLESSSINNFYCGQCFLIANSKCKDCNLKFLVRSDFEKVKRDGVDIEERTTEWTQIKHAINDKEAMIQTLKT